jgi:hypothetical protein
MAYPFGRCLLYFASMTETTRTPDQGRFIVATLQNAHDLVVEAEILLRD